MPLLGHAEKAELEKVILERLEALFRQQGAAGILDPRLRVVLHGNGVDLDHGDTRDPLAAVEVRTLFTALCYAEGGDNALPEAALRTLATEAMTAAAVQVNRLSPS